MYQIARTVATQRGLDAWDSARLLGLTSMAIADGYIAGFKIRYVYDFWRPVTAIREGDTDGNDATAGDPSWNSLQNTPSVSDYPSTQSTFSGAVAEVLAGVLGTDQVSFSLTSGPPFPDIKRSFTSFSQAAQESADSRVYAGIHFRTACKDGLTLGFVPGSRPTAPGVSYAPLPAGGCTSTNALFLPSVTVEEIVNHDAISTALFDPVARQTIEWKVHWLFRIALFCEFVGHGAFGVLTKAAWVHYFALFGFSEAWAWKLMPVVGSVDIALGC
jgi:hypothetical protein